MSICSGNIVMEYMFWEHRSVWRRRFRIWFLVSVSSVYFEQGIAYWNSWETRLIRCGGQRFWCFAFRTSSNCVGGTLRKVCSEYCLRIDEFCIPDGHSRIMQSHRSLITRYIGSEKCLTRRLCRRRCRLYRCRMLLASWLRNFLDLMKHHGKRKWNQIDWRDDRYDALPDRMTHNWHTAATSCGRFGN